MQAKNWEDWAKQSLRMYGRLGQEVFCFLSSGTELWVGGANILDRVLEVCVLVSTGALRGYTSLLDIDIEQVFRNGAMR